MEEIIVGGRRKQGHGGEELLQARTGFAELLLPMEEL